MSLTNIKLKNRADSGFTIVELLIVVVVIAILAAITIVSYNGITTRANASAAKASAATAQKKLSLYQSDPNGTGTYPTTWAALTADSSKAYYVTGLTFKTSAPVATDGTNTIQYLICGRASSGTSPVAAPTTLAGVTGGVITGAQVVYWDFSAQQNATINIDSTSANGPVVVGSTTYNVACFSPAS